MLMFTRSSRSKEPLLSVESSEIKSQPKPTQIQYGSFDSSEVKSPPKSISTQYALRYAMIGYDKCSLLACANYIFKENGKCSAADLSESDYHSDWSAVHRIGTYPKDCGWSMARYEELLSSNSVNGCCCILQGGIFLWAMPIECILTYTCKISDRSLFRPLGGFFGGSCGFFVGKGQEICCNSEIQDSEPSAPPRQTMD